MTTSGMGHLVTGALAALSISIRGIVADAAPLVCAIRLGGNRHITGLICPGDTIATTDQALPVADTYTVVLPGGQLAAACPGPRDPDRDLGLLLLQTPRAVVAPAIAIPEVGALVIVVGADHDASPTARLTIVHRTIRTADGPAALLDLAGDSADPGSLVLDAGGNLIGLAVVSPSGAAMAIPGAAINRMLPRHQLLHPAPGRDADTWRGAPVAPRAPLPMIAPSNRRGWLGVALQPTTMPDHLAARAGQGSGRMVVSITKGGPADMGNLRLGDVLLALNGTSASGPQALRAFLGSERVGTTVEVKLLRDGNLLTTHLTVAEQP